MRLAPVVCLLVTGVASADPALQEYGNGVLPRPASQLAATGCELDLQLRGAIVDAELHQRIHDAGPATLGAVYELDLPAAARVIGLALRDRTTAVGVSVPAGGTPETVEDAEVVGPDPAILLRVGLTDGGRMRYRAVLQPLGAGRDTTLAVHWTEVATIRDGALHVRVLGRPGPPGCLVRVTAQPGPGARVQAIRAGTAVLPERAPTFTLGDDDVDVEVELAFAGRTPLAWLQRVDAGGGITAQTLTVIAPPLRAEGARRVVLVIDTSRSMELVGRPNVRRLVRALGNALPQGAELEAILYDRTATRVLGGWKPATTATLDAIDAALVARPAANGSDLAGALAAAHPLVTERGRGQAMVVAITDGALGEVTGAELAAALGATADQVDVHAIVLDPDRMHGPAAAALRGTVGRHGGAYVEVGIGELDDALAEVASWLRPAWLDLKVRGFELPSELRAGAGVVAFALAAKPDRVALVARAEQVVNEPARAAPAAPIAELALDRADPDALDDAVRAKLAAQHPVVDDNRALAVLSTVGRVAASRRQMIAGGGPYTRMVAIDDPTLVPLVHIGTATATGPSAIDRPILQRLLADQLQPRAYACYQRALGLAPTLAGTVTFTLDVGRGEVTHVLLAGTEHAAFDACLVDAAYGMTPPLPTPGWSPDDRTIVTYPLTFAVRDRKPFVLPGDADSSSPLDIDAIEGGVPPRRLDVDTRTPLGGLKPPRGP